MKNQIVIVEDDKEIREGVEIYLRSQGYTVFQAENGKEGLAIIEREKIDLAIVDIMMPVMDGITKVMGLNIGADDYVTKPFTPMELMARVNSQLRRYNRFQEALNKKEEKERSYMIGGLEVNEDRVEVLVDGRQVKMTPIEFKILLLLIKHPGRVFSAEEIYERVWNEKAVNTETIMVHIRNIREKIEINPKEPKYVKVVWGIGYKMEKQM